MPESPRPKPLHVAAAIALFIICWSLSAGTIAYAALCVATALQATTRPEILTILAIIATGAVIAVGLSFTAAIQRKMFKCDLSEGFRSTASLGTHVAVGGALATFLSPIAWPAFEARRVLDHPVLLGTMVSAGVLVLFFMTRGMSRAMNRILGLARDPLGAWPPAGIAFAAAPRTPGHDEMIARYGARAVRDILQVLPEGTSADEMSALLEKTRSNYAPQGDQHRAHHEARHIVAYTELGALIVGANIYITGDTGGSVERLLTSGTLDERLWDDIVGTLSTVDLGLTEGIPAGHGNDLQRAMLYAQNLHLLRGVRSPGPQALIDSGITEARRIIAANAEAVEALTNALVEHRELSGREIRKILNEVAKGYNQALRSVPGVAR